MLSKYFSIYLHNFSPLAVARYLIVKYIAEQLLNISRVMKMEQIK